MRYFPLLFSFVLVACATTGEGENRIAIETSSNNQVIAGANCVASNRNGSWNFTSPATIDTGGANGDLRIVCSKAGYRTSEYVYRPSQSSGSSLGVGLGGGGSRVGGGIGFSLPIGGGGGQYPSKVTIDMSPTS